MPIQPESRGLTEKPPRLLTSKGGSPRVIPHHVSAMVVSHCCLLCSSAWIKYSKQEINQRTTNGAQKSIREFTPQSYEKRGNVFRQNLHAQKTSHLPSTEHASHKLGIHPNAGRETRILQPGSFLCLARHSTPTYLDHNKQHASVDFSKHAAPQCRLSPFLLRTQTPTP